MRETDVVRLQAVYMPGGNYPDSYGGGTVIIPHAFNTSNHKAVLSYGGSVEYLIQANTGRWASNSAITSVTLTAEITSFIAGSVFQLGVIDERYLVEEVNLVATDNITFAGIPGTGDDLVVIGYVRGTSGGFSVDLWHNINGDAVAANYWHQYVRGVGGAASSATFNSVGIGTLPILNSTANVFGAFYATYSEYAEATNDPVAWALSGFHESVGADSRVKVVSARRNNVAAITQLEYMPQTGSFAVGTLFSLYRVPRTLIDRQELVAPAATITFSNIPQGYEALQLNVYARTDGAVLTDNVSVEINGDAVATNYDYQALWGTAGVTVANRNLASQSWMVVPGNNMGANEYGGGIITFYQYGKTDRYKHATVLTGNVEDWVGMYSCRWENTDNITQIVLSPLVGGNWLAGSIFELVGLMPDKTFHLIIDDVVEAITASANLTVTDNANDYNIGMNNVLPYLEYFTIWKEDEY